MTIRTRVRITAPILSTDISSIPVKTPIVGSYSGPVPASNSDEFRVVGVMIKRRGAAGETEEVSEVSDTKVTSTSATSIQRDAAKPALPEACEVKSVNALVKDNEGAEEEAVLGDLVVDCTGSNSVGEKWAKTKWGITIPTSEIRAGSMYVSHLFEEPPDFKADWICCPVYPTPGFSTRFGYLMRVENGIWQLTGMGTAHTPVDNTSLETFINHFKKLDNPYIYELLTTPSKATGKPPQPLKGEKLHTYYPKLYMRRHYELTPQWPEGLVAVGNSACIFDPMYGQGMSGACIAALSLNKALQQSAFQGSAGVRANGFARAYHVVLADRLAFPWTLCVGEDRRWSKIVSCGPAADANLHWFTKALQFWIRQGMVLAQHYPLAQRTAMGIMNMTISFTSLLNPPLVYLVAKNVLLESLSMTVTPEQMYAKIVEGKRKAGLIGDDE